MHRLAALFRLTRGSALGPRLPIFAFWLAAFSVLNFGRVFCLFAARKRAREAEHQQPAGPPQRRGLLARLTRRSRAA